MAMQAITMTERGWARLLAMGNGEPDSDCDDAASALYGPIARRGARLVLAQVGQSLDGRIATPAGDARDVSGCDGLAHLHRCRALVDAVIVGIGTVKADDPSLSVRLVSGNSPVRVIIDSNGELTGAEKLLTDGGAPVIVVQGDDAPPPRHGAQIIRLPRGASGLDPRDIVDALGEHALTRLLVEGGAKTIGRFVSAGLIDRLHISVSPIIIGSGPTGICLPPVDHLRDACRPKVTVYDIGTDVVFDCDFR